MRCGPGVLAMLALSGCVAVADHAPTPLPTARWWQDLGDPPLSLLIERSLPRSAARPGLGEAQASLAAEIARRYIDLRARQTALVLLAEREDLDQQRASIVQRYPRVAAAQAQLAATRAAQARVRADIAMLRDSLAKLTGPPPGALDSIAGGPIPLPTAPRASAIRTAPHHSARQTRLALARYQAARRTAADAQARAVHARIVAALRSIAARAGTVAPAKALDADRHALAALQAEEQARTAMTQAYVTLAMAMRSIAGSD